MTTQDDVRDYLITVDQATLKEIVENCPRHYHNGHKHVGATLSRMVQNGKVTRVKRGVFKLNAFRERYMANAGAWVDPDQTALNFMIKTAY